MRFLEWISTFVNENVLRFYRTTSIHMYKIINEFKLNQINWNALQLDFLWNVLEGKNNNNKKQSIIIRSTCTCTVIVMRLYIQVHTK